MPVAMHYAVDYLKRERAAKAKLKEAEAELNLVEKEREGAVAKAAQGKDGYSVRVKDLDKQRPGLAEVVAIARSELSTIEAEAANLRFPPRVAAVERQREQFGVLRERLLEGWREAEELAGQLAAKLRGVIATRNEMDALVFGDGPRLSPNHMEEYAARALIGLGLAVVPGRPGVRTMAGPGGSTHVEWPKAPSEKDWAAAVANDPIMQPSFLDDFI